MGLEKTVSEVRPLQHPSDRQRRQRLSDVTASCDDKELAREPVTGRCDSRQPTARRPGDNGCDSPKPESPAGRTSCGLRQRQWPGQDSGARPSKFDNRIRSDCLLVRWLQTFVGRPKSFSISPPSSPIFLHLLVVIARVYSPVCVSCRGWLCYCRRGWQACFLVVVTTPPQDVAVSVCLTRAKRQEHVIAPHMCISTQAKSVQPLKLR